MLQFLFLWIPLFQFSVHWWTTDWRCIYCSSSPCSTKKWSRSSNQGLCTGFETLWNSRWLSLWTILFWKWPLIFWS